jgi:death-on-curing family protein
MWDLTVPGNNDHDFYVLAERSSSQRTHYVVAGDTPVLVHNQTACGLGGFKNSITPDEINSINQGFGGSTLLNGSPENMLANAERYDGFFNKAAVVVRDIAGSHMYDNGNKRTAQAVVEALMQRNGVLNGPTSQELRGVIDQVATGQLTSIDDIAAALRGYP